MPAIAFSARPHDSGKPYSFSYGGKEYVASSSMLPTRLGKRWQLFIVTPLNDFTSPVKHNDRRLLFGGLIAMDAIGVGYAGRQRHHGRAHESRGA